MTGDPFLDQLQTQLWLVSAVFFRVAPFVALLPGLGETSVSVRIKLALALGFTALVFPMAQEEVSLTGTTLSALVPVLLVETSVGILLGLGMRILLLGLQTAGTIAAQSTSLSQVFGNAGVEPMPAMGHILLVGGIALAMILGLHIKAVAFFVASYAAFPFADPLSAAGVGQWGVSQIAQAFRLAFALAVPFVILSLLYNLALGVINKAMPQLMVAFVGAPAITMGGLVVLMAAAPLMLETWHHALDSYLANPLEPAQR